MSEYSTAPWLSEEGKPAEVNQRALIPKVLARYPGEFTVFRELLQNSDDAHSSAVEIHFETNASKQTKPESRIPSYVGSSEVVRWIFKNNGKPFTSRDWCRLAKIAEGNPDPEKVGAFGVGFYCLFSVTDSPLVSSGGHGMQLYWKDGVDQLLIREGDLPSEEESSAWTIFNVPLREPGHMPSGIALLQFLATSITFMVHLKDVKVFFNKRCIGRVEKLPGLVDVVQPPDAMQRQSPSKMLTVGAIRCHRFTIKAGISTNMQESLAETPQSFEQCDPANDPQDLSMSLDSAQLDLTVFKADVDVAVGEKLSRELFRCTAKKLPLRIQYSLVYTGKDAYDHSYGNQNTPAFTSIFQGLRADLNGALHTKIFIGHPTSQTTGIGGHMESPFIPTVERESIDLVDRNIAQWNNELLYVGGLLCRIVYELELSDIQASWDKAITPRNTSHPPSDLQAQLRRQFIHVLKFFTFHHSTPSQKVAEQMKQWFYDCSPSPLRLLTSVGVRDTSKIRSCDPLCAQFLKYVPMLSSDVMDEGQGVIGALPKKHEIQPVTPADVLQDLRLHALEEGELVTCLQWQVVHTTPFERREFLGIVRYRPSGGESIQLSSIRYFINPDGFGAHIPLEGPQPPYLISRRITRSLSPRSLETFGWKEFTVVNWLQYISLPEVRSRDPKYDYASSINWAYSVLRSVALAWTFSEELRSLAKSLLGEEKCIPVHGGLCYPGKSYISNQNIPAFDDLQLPVVCLPSGDVMTPEMQQLLIALGVQQHLPPRLLLAQMVDTKKWTTSKLIDYLVKVADTLSPADISELKSSRAFSKEGAADTERFSADELYPPLDSFRQLQLPLIEWEGRSEWQESSPEAKLLYRLGLCRHPPLGAVIGLCSSENATVRTNAFKYLCDNLRSVYTDYKAENYQDVTFIPAEDMDGPRLERMNNVFLDSQWKTLGFPVIQNTNMESYIKELGVQRHPPSSLLVQLLETRPPPNKEKAQRWFEILSEHIASFSQEELDKLSRLQIVPKTVPGHQVYLTPVQCYLGSSAKDDFYSKLFHFVNFGSVANRFLGACHAKNEPSEEDIAKSLLEDPVKFYEGAKRERYLKEVRQLAIRQNRITNDTLSKMREKPVLLGIQLKKNADGGDTCPLWKPRDIVIVDDVAACQLFDDTLVIAPRDVAPELEKFYELLGCNYLSKVICDQCRDSEEIPDVEACSEYQKLVVERVPIFLHHYPHPQAMVLWPSNAGAISVKRFQCLSVSTTLTVGNKETSKERDAWATARYDQGEIQLWLSRSAKKDMYEIAVSLCRVLFGTVDLSDALLLATILSEDLDVLKRRGYEVDQVLKLQESTIDCVPTSAVDNACNPCKLEKPCIPSGALGQSATTKKSIEATTRTACAQTTLGHSAGGLLSGGIEVAAGLSIPSVQIPLAFTNVVNKVIRVVAHGTSRDKTVNEPIAVLPPSPWDARQVLPRTYIQSNVSKAVKMCSTKARSPLNDHGQADVTKFLKDYCNTAKPINNLRSLGKVDNVEVFVSQGAPDADTLMQQKQEQLLLFIRIIITPVVKVYKLPLDSINVFYNLTAGCIAFNDKGVVYLNLKYFEAWHYQDVKRGHAQQALSSWFLTIAHEMAHNLVANHDSQHEFWFSAICEAHMETFSRLLGAPPPESVQAGGERDG